MPVRCHTLGRFLVLELCAGRGRADNYRVPSMSRPTGTDACSTSLMFRNPTRKAHSEMIMQQQSCVRPRRIRAALIGLGLDAQDNHQRLTRGGQSLVLGGSAETHDELRETVLRMELELDRQGQRLGDLDPLELAELAWRIDSPELHQIALRLEAGLEERGRRFEELSAEELTAILTPEMVKASG